MFVGDHLTNDVAAPVSHGMRAALGSSGTGCALVSRSPAARCSIRHVRELPALLEIVGNQQ